MSFSGQTQLPSFNGLNPKKVFVGIRVAEIQSLTDIDSWRYVDSANNPADVITRGQSLKDLTPPCRWINGPNFHVMLAHFASR